MVISYWQCKTTLTWDAEETRYAIHSCPETAEFFALAVTEDGVDGTGFITIDITSIGADYGADAGAGSTDSICTGYSILDKSGLSSIARLFTGY
jgi:hypothetical protein